MSLAAWHLSEKELAGEFVRRCFASSDPNPTPPANISIRHDRGAKDLTWTQALDQIGHGIKSTTLIDLLYLFRNYHTPAEGTYARLLQSVSRTMEACYHQSLLREISPVTRHSLIRIEGIVRPRLNDSYEARSIWVMLTSMCSPRELLMWTETLFREDLGAPSHTYSPCLSGGRTDYTRHDFRRLLSAAGRDLVRGDVALGVAQRFRITLAESSHEAICLPETTTRSVVTARDATYVVTDQYLLKALSYPITNTVVGKNLLVSVLPRFVTCVLSNQFRERGQIRVQDNITMTERCEYCGSTLVEYDEADGVVSLVYLADPEHLSIITDPQNQILIDNPRVHYLLLTSNGTVLEITDIFVSLRRFNYAVIGLIIAAILVILFAICRIARRTRL